MKCLLLKGLYKHNSIEMEISSEIMVLASYWGYSVIFISNINMPVHAIVNQWEYFIKAIKSHLDPTIDQVFWGCPILSKRTHVDTSFKIHVRLYITPTHLITDCTCSLFNPHLAQCIYASSRASNSCEVLPFSMRVSAWSWCCLWFFYLFFFWFDLCFFLSVAFFF